MHRAFVIILSSTLLLLSPIPVAAQIQNPVKFNTLEEVINSFLGLIRPVVVLTLIGILMYGGWVYLNAKDSDDEVKRARKIMAAAIVGFVIIVIAPVIVQIIGAFLGVQDGLLDTVAPK